MSNPDLPGVVGCGASECTVDVVRMDLSAHLFIPFLQVPLEARAEGVHCSSEFSHTSRGPAFGDLTRCHFASSTCLAASGETCLLHPRIRSANLAQSFFSSDPTWQDTSRDPEAMRKF